MTPLVLALAIAGAPVHPLDDLTGGDKVLHAGACATVTLAGYGAAAWLDAPLPVRLAAGAGAGAAAGLAKEVLDLAGFGTPSLGDLVYDALGVGVGLGLSLAIDAVLRDRADHRVE